MISIHLNIFIYTQNCMLLTKIRDKKRLRKSVFGYGDAHEHPIGGTLYERPPVLNDLILVNQVGSLIRRSTVYVCTKMPPPTRMEKL